MNVLVHHEFELKSFPNGMIQRRLWWVSWIFTKFTDEINSCFLWILFNAFFVSGTRKWFKWDATVADSRHSSLCSILSEKRLASGLLPVVGLQNIRSQSKGYSISPPANCSSYTIYLICNCPNVNEKINILLLPRTAEKVNKIKKRSDFTSIDFYLIFDKQLTKRFQ